MLGQIIFIGKTTLTGGFEAMKGRKKVCPGWKLNLSQIQMISNNRRINNAKLNNSPERFFISDRLYYGLDRHNMVLHRNPQRKRGMVLCLFGLSDSIVCFFSKSPRTGFQPNRPNSFWNYIPDAGVFWNEVILILMKSNFSTFSKRYGNAHLIILD